MLIAWRTRSDLFFADPVKDLAGIEQGGPTLHRRRLVGEIVFLAAAEMASWDDSGRAHFFGVIFQRPENVALDVVVQRERQEMPRDLVPVQLLRRRFREDADNLRQVELKARL